MNPHLGRPLRYGMVGGGPGAFIGGVHRMASALDREWELVAGAFSSEAKRSRRGGRELGLDPGRVYGSYGEMARAEANLPDEERIEAVSIVTPNHLHHPIATAFLQAGVDVVCDKPMTTTVAEAEELCLGVRESGRVFALTYNYTGYPMAKEARHLVRTGRVGGVRKVVAEYRQGWLATRLEGEGHKQAEWRQDPKRAGGSSALADIGSHLHNLVRYVTGLRIDAIFADLSTHVGGRVLEDDAGILVRFAGGARGVFNVSQVAAGEENGLELRVHGERGTLHWRQEDPNRLHLLRRERPRETITRGSPWLSAPALHAARLPPGHPEGFIEAFANIYRSAGRAIGARIAGVQTHPLDREFPDHRDGLAGVRFVARAIESHARGGWIQVEEDQVEGEQ